MSKKLINKLIAYSYKKNILDANSVNKVIKYLRRNDLKHYIEALKAYEKKLTVFIDVPINNIDIKDKFENIFPNKKIIWSIVPSLMLGTRIMDNDMLFEINLKNALEKIRESIVQNYD